MSIGQGVASRCALGVESVFGTAVAVSEIIPFTSESINRAITQLESQYLEGNVARRNLKNSVISVVGGLECELIFDEESGDPIGIERLLRGALGASARDAVNGLNQYKTANAVDDHYTICFNKQVSNWETSSAKINTLTINAEAGGKGMIATDIVAYNLLRTGDAGIVNAIAAVTGLANTTQPENLAFDDLVFRIGDQVDALTSADQYKIDNFELVINNNLIEPTWSTPDSVHTDSLLTLESIRNGFREMNLAITLPRYDSDQNFTWLNNDTPLQCDLKFTSGSYEFNILLPNIKIMGDPTAQIGGAELIKPEINIMALANNGQNTFMAFQDSDTITDEIGIEAKSGRSTAA
jgi:hypothetical protein